MNGVLELPPVEIAAVLPVFAESAGVEAPNLNGDDVALVDALSFPNIDPLLAAAAGCCCAPNVKGLALLLAAACSGSSTAVRFLARTGELEPISVLLLLLTPKKNAGLFATGAAAVDDEVVPKEKLAGGGLSSFFSAPNVNVGADDAGAGLLSVVPKENVGLEVGAAASSGLLSAAFTPKLNVGLAGALLDISVSEGCADFGSSVTLAAGLAVTGAPKVNVGAGFAGAASLFFSPLNLGFGASQAGHFSTVTGLVHIQSSQVYVADAAFFFANMALSEPPPAGAASFFANMALSEFSAAGGAAFFFANIAASELSPADDDEGASVDVLALSVGVVESTAFCLNMLDREVLFIGLAVEEEEEVKADGFEELLLSVGSVGRGVGSSGCLSGTRGGSVLLVSVVVTVRVDRIGDSWCSGVCAVLELFAISEDVNDAAFSGFGTAGDSLSNFAAACISFACVASDDFSAFSFRRIWRLRGV